ncbi:acyl-CoA dehydrogenase family protein [Streptomyces europaeiscabiei]|uniref:Acyl-CoA dehydrogenase family protein n=1 Tax=Streptomyces europaeiscabiei TaxID=146819 RepID=A0ABU4NGT8_9ACTN|nr:acyl-CoA dehydrogenase family protein [Streptomyces europaeiscabiei]MDX3544512.1 acyl-CoA dehydrogenase family protein [Streptomyces europaeiscabiei]MDX3553861.1 acyl-CoA dehydrogenase family protein [Streptomyces europaeiscabiei]MDX3701979.1 acyl-CoA dehydrogenase family protein [Streptomyces europaeiscabiei]MDX3782157.1 acyl-CoA dehydrogenase family protein [Streptomyces europaeiscabiei]MDX3844859.1 acyl-CoA dehydrogenase family protein [Streptomyces europaeiscabiei]
MDLAYSPAEEEFRARLREWLAKVLPSTAPKPSPDDWAGRRAYDLGWQRMLYDAGYADVHWDASPTTRLIFLEETERAGAPYVGANFVGLLHAGPTIAAEGTAEQRARWLPPILRGEEVWCQGFSEPDAGSDLAALRTHARRDGDAYVVTGSKIWTSHAEVADWCELLVRTDASAPKHRGISWLAMPMDAPGVTVRPLRTLAGSTEFAEVFLDEVRVPVANRVGEENDGWRVTMVTLSFERGTAFVGEVVACRRVLGEIAREARANGRWDDSAVRRRLGRLNAEFRALWRLTQWNVSAAEASGGVPGVGGSVFKLRYSRARQELYDVAADVLGPGALDLGRPWVLDRLSSLSYTIAAGTSEIQRNIVGERILGLPKG